MEVSRELNSTIQGWLQPTWKMMWQKQLLEMTHQVRTWRKCAPNRILPDSAMNFGVGLMQPGVICCPLQAEVLRGGTLQAMPLACTSECSHSDIQIHLAGSLSAGLWGFPGVTQPTFFLWTSSPLTNSQNLGTSLARKPQLRKWVLWTVGGLAQICWCPQIIDGICCHETFSHFQV